MTNILREKNQRNIIIIIASRKKNHEVNPRKSKATAIKTLKLSQKRW